MSPAMGDDVVIPWSTIESGTPTCPTGYTQIKAPIAIDVANTSCPDGYVDVGDVTSCLATSPDTLCMMFITTDMRFSDDTGIFGFSEICPYTADFLSL